MNPWKVLSEKLLLERPWLTIVEQSLKTARGVVIDEYHLLKALDWACVCAVTEEDELVLVRQYRHGVARVTLELPAGAIDSGEAPLTAAQRELLEETGYVGKNWAVVSALNPETTRHRHQAHVFFTDNARRVAAPQLDATEDIEVELVPISQVLQNIDRGEFSHAVHIAALLLTAQKGYLKLGGMAGPPESRVP